MLALDSNGLRVLFRLGYGDMARSYDGMYRSVQQAVTRELAADTNSLIRAHQLLRRQRRPGRVLAHFVAAGVFELDVRPADVNHENVHALSSLPQPLILPETTAACRTLCRRADAAVSWYDLH